MNKCERCGEYFIWPPFHYARVLSGSTVVMAMIARDSGELGDFENNKDAMVLCGKQCAMNQLNDDVDPVFSIEKGYGT